jgi:hypothetical protein
MEGIDTMSHIMNVSQTMNVPQTMNTSQSNTLQITSLQTNKKTKNNYKNMMSELMKPLPKEDKPNIHLGGGVFQKLEKI